MADRAKDSEGNDLAVKLNEGVAAVDECDGWLSVDLEGYGIKYLPTSNEEMAPGQVLMEPAVVLQCVSCVVYRNSKNMDDRAKDAEGNDLLCNVKDALVAVDAGDGWFSVAAPGY